MTFATDYKAKASKAYLEYIRAINDLMSMLETEITFAKMKGVSDYGIELLEARRDTYSQEIEEADRIISRLERLLADVLRRQYIECQSQSRIAEEIGYDKRTVQRFNVAGCEELYDYLPMEYR